MSSGQKLGPQEAYDLGMERDSWCTVEKKKEEDWCRATRKHYSQQFKSEVFNSGVLIESEPRCSFQVNTPTHRERKHFGVQCKLNNILKIFLYIFLRI